MTAGICIAALTALCTISSDTQAQTSGKRPNLIVIFADADNGLTMVSLTAIVEQLTGSFPKYPNFPTSPGGASIGSELTEWWCRNGSSGRKVPD